MRRIYLRGTTLECSVLGFGCAPLGSRVGSGDGLHALERALDLGITHFDVAPSYGRGLAEEILGRFLRRRRHAVTVCTKFGIAPGARPFFLRAALPLARSAVRLLSPLRTRLARAAPARRHQRIAVPALLESVNRSLTALGTDYIDILAYHECDAGEALRGELIDALQGLKTSGKVRYVAAATAVEDCSKIFQPNAAGCYQIYQFENSPLAPTMLGSPARLLRGSAGALITHGPFGHGNGIATLLRRASVRGDLAQRLARLGVRLSAAEDVAEAMLRFALTTNREGVVLCSAFELEHLERNVSTASKTLPLPIEAVYLLAELGCREEARA